MENNYDNSRESMNSENNYSRKQDLTLKELKSCPVFARFSDDQALEIIATIKQFTVIVYNFWQNYEGKTWNKEVKSVS